MSRSHVRRGQPSACAIALALIACGVAPAVVEETTITGGPTSGDDDSDDAASTDPDAHAHGLSPSASAGTSDGLTSDMTSPTGAIYDLGAPDDLGAGACESIQITGEPTPPDVVLVLDRSGSMSAPSGVGSSRWDDLTAAVDAIVDAYDDKVLLGVRFLPPAALPGDVECTPQNPMNNAVEVPVAAGHGAAILTAMAAASPDGADTPTLPAMQAALKHLDALPGERGEQYVILVADGETNSCGAPAQVAAAIAAAHAKGVTTYAVSVGWEVDELGLYAQAGGSGDYLPTYNLTSLTATLDAIVAGLISCTIPLAQPPEHPDSVELTVAGVEFPRVADCDEASGWAWTSPDHDAVELCGAACEALKQTGEVSLTYHCPLG
ncbi:MAG: vWA domain-containing protein [Nannocystaceae bacterium]